MEDLMSFGLLVMGMVILVSSIALYNCMKKKEASNNGDVSEVESHATVLENQVTMLANTSVTYETDIDIVSHKLSDVPIYRASGLFSPSMSMQRIGRFTVAQTTFNTPIGRTCSTRLPRTQREEETRVGRFTVIRRYSCPI
ncbi:unnamed protein product [Meganyctiphanes norvegica]|uniref:Uncharacterized protein n=1 Tax=Meganyctiphanes norvegica TaxID=48144 RepID=A0AAV2RKI2_MEGNR